MAGQDREPRYKPLMIDMLRAKLRALAARGSMRTALT